jgi:enolase
MIHILTSSRFRIEIKMVMDDLFSIRSTEGLEILDSRGNPTLRVIVTTAGGVSASGDAPAGVSKGSREAVEVRDPDRLGGMGVLRAVNNVKDYVNPALRGMDVRDQANIDGLLKELDITPNKSRIGGNVTIATSIAVAKAAAKASGMELFRYLGGVFNTIPIPLLNVINGGLHGGNKLKVQEFILIPHGFNYFSDSLMAAVEIYKRLKQELISKYGKIYTGLGDEGGFSPPLEKVDDALGLLSKVIEELGYKGKVSLGIDPAATDFYDNSKGKYEVDGKFMTSGELIDYYISLASRYDLLYIEDPFQEDDLQSFSELNSKLTRTMVVGDDLYTTNVEYLRKGLSLKTTKGVIVKPNQVGTLTETFQFCREAMDGNNKLVVSHRSGETEDSFTADLAVALSAHYVKTGAPARGERTAKYNRLLEIEKTYHLEYRGKIGLR